MKDFFIVFLVAIVSDNYVLSRWFGLDLVIDSSGDARPAFAVGISVIINLFISTLFIWPISRYILEPMNMMYLYLMVCIVMMFVTSKLIWIVSKNLMPKIFGFVEAYLPVVAISSAVLGPNLVNAISDVGYGGALASSLGAGVGFLVCTLIFSGIRSRINESNISKSFDGIPISFIAAGITALAFSGLSGVTQNIFG